MTRGRLLAGLVTVLLISVLAAGLTRWSVTDPAMRRSLMANIAQESGWNVHIQGPVTIRLLPRPTIEADQIALADVNGAIAAQADAFKGRLDFLSLLRGSMQFNAATLDSPTMTVDLDALGSAITARGGNSWSPPRLIAALRAGGLTVREGVIRLHAKEPNRDTLLTDVSATVAWPSRDGEFSISGAGTWRGIDATFLAFVERPAAVTDGGQTAASLRVKSSLLDLTADGTLSGADGPRATGRLSASTPDLPGLLRRIELPMPQLTGFRDARLAGAATLAGDTLALDDAALSLDDMLFDGALALRAKEGRASLAGTLATDRIDLGHFLQPLPLPLDAKGAWDTRALSTRAVAEDDIDLRVSATTIQCGPMTLEDGSLSLQSGKGRMELSLGEARAYDGLLKGRVLAAADGDQTQLHLDATLSRVDLDRVRRDLPVADGASGIFSGHLSLDSRGRTPAELAAALRGDGDLTLRNGELGGPIAEALVRPAPTAQAATLPISAGTGTFDEAMLGFTLTGGTALVTSGRVNWPSAHATLAGTASVPAQTTNIRVTISDADLPGGGATDYAIEGPWRDLRLAVVRPPS